MKRIVSGVLVLCLLLLGCALAETADELEDMLTKGSLFVEQEDYSSAEICYDIAMRLSPDDPVVLSAVATMYACMEDYERSLALIEEAIALAPADGSLYLDKARVLFLKGELEAADLALRYAAVCGAEMDDSLRVTAAAAYAEGGNDAKAVELFEQAEQELWWADYSELYGQALLRSGARDRAQQLGLIAAAAGDEALTSAIRNGQPVGLSVCEKEILDFPMLCSAVFYEENKEAAQEAGVSGEVSADGLRIRIQDRIGDEFAEQPVLQAVSPSGEISLYSFNGSLVIARNGEATIVTPNPSRGAQDAEYASLTYGMYDRLGKMLEQDSVAWSPDERYFALTFRNHALMLMQFLDLMLVDTQTGELFVVEATPKKMGEEGAQTAVCACFDPSGENVYYLVYGDVGENSRCGVKRYNIAEGTAELLCDTGDIFVDRPNIYMDFDGSIRGITDSVRENERVGRILFTQKDGEWTYAVREFSNSMQMQLPVRYLYSDAGNVELTLNTVRSSAYGAMYIAFSADAQNTPVDDQALMLPREGSKAELVGIDEAFIAAYVGRNAEQSEETGDSPWLQVGNAALSPDGYYALIAAGDPGEQGLYLLDIQSLEFIELEMPDEVELVATMDSVSSGSARLDWISGNRILISVPDGNLLCELQIG